MSENDAYERGFKEALAVHRVDLEKALRRIEELEKAFHSFQTQENHAQCLLIAIQALELMDNQLAKETLRKIRGKL